MEIARDRGVVLLIVEEAVEEHARRQRDRDSQAFLPVPDVPAAEEVNTLWAAMGCGPGEGIDRDSSRYHQVCIVAFPTSPVRTWVGGFFGAEMPWLVEAGGLSFCVPPFDPRHATLVTPAEAERLAREWERLRPAASLASSRGSGSGGWWSACLAVRPADPDVFHLRAADDRRSFCGLRAKDLEAPDPYPRDGDIPDDRLCHRCARHWFEHTKAERERDRRDLGRRLEAVTGLLRALDHLEAIHRTAAAAPDWHAAHSALTGPPFGFSDLQAWHILTFPLGQQNAAGRADLEAIRSRLLHRLSDLDAYLLAGPNREAQA